jgi:hypothetical protein
MIRSSVHSVIRRNHVFRYQSGSATAAALVIIGACAATAIAGCSSAASSSTRKNTDVSSTETTATVKALRLAANASDHVNSLTAKIKVHSSGTGTGTGDLAGTVSLQLKPTKIISASFNVTQAKSGTIQLDEILTGKAIYFKDPAFTKAAGKPWVETSISDASSKVGVSLGSLLQNLESSNPLDQARLFNASKNAHKVGTAVIDGVPTTEYAGTYEPAVALAELSPQFRKQIGPTLKSIGSNAVQFEVWLDAHHIVRQAEDTDNVRGQVVTTELDVTSVNKPVKVALPPASEVAPLPKV